MEEKKVTHSAGVFNAIFVRDSFMLPNSGSPESVNLGVNCKDESAVTKIKTEVNDLCVSSDELCDTGLQGNVCDMEIMPPELNTTFIEAEYMEENTNSDNNPVQDPLLLTEKDFLDFAKRENLKIDFNLGDKNIIRAQIKGVESDRERRVSYSFICPVIKKENTETNSFEQIASEGMQDALNCASVKRESVSSQRSGDVGMEVERTDPDPSHEQLVLREDNSERARVSSLRGEESRLDEDGDSSTEVMSVASRKGKHTFGIKGVRRKKGEFTPDNDPTASQAIKLRMCPASKKKCSTKSVKKINVNVSEGESNPLTEHSLGQRNHIIGSSEFTTDREQKMHRTTHTGDEPFKCSDCEYKCYNKGELKRHIRTHTKPFQCTICDYKCSEKHNLKTHLMSHSADKPFQCTLCDYKCSQKQHLKTHLISHSGDKPFECAICDYKCSLKHQLKTHLMRHSGDKPFKCAICDYKCSQNNQLKTHLMSHSGDKPFQCTICDYKCTHKGNLKRHLMRHSGDKHFQCTICDFKFAEKHDLKRHLMSHSGDKPFQCTLCDFKFAQKNNLMTHLRTHSGDKPFQCTICEYQCSRKQHLKMHLMSHSGDKPFECAICDYKCSHKQLLESHLRSHSGDKPFQCSICDYKFSQKQNLKRHHLSHSGDKPYQCAICDYKCSLKKNLQRHLMSH